MNTQATLTEADQTFTDLLQTLQAIPQDKINTVPFAGSWTAAECAQHIILSAGGIVQVLNGPVKDTNRDPEQNVANFRAMFLSTENKFTSPADITPEEKEYDKQQLVKSIQDIKAGYLNEIKNLDLSKTITSFEFPGVGHITRAEGIAFTNTHTIRHVRQLKNIVQKLGSN